MLTTANYLLVDTSGVKEEISTAVALNAGHRSLSRRSSPANAVFEMPYLFALEQHPGFVDWVFQNGWGKAWGIFVTAHTDFDSLYRHFRRFLTVITENGRRMYFRYYDPRVLRVFLPTCDTQQLKDFFGPVQQFICEEEDHGYGLLFSFDGSRLITERVATSSIFSTEEAGTSGIPGADHHQHKPPRKFFY